ncbi:HAD-like domain-containing protein [Armillaria luteobubalina]|uniref:HAD-like domain-containing protein n=1 Tax=Armillaria luteobubalina TaxID=153913 RepID=A0AA39QK01_9AGAR|nr:HAD-like domain-containing protein [Armillaria luteobubalina]
MSSTHTFYADAVLFDMDGTLTDSIQAVEAAWGKVAKDIGEDPAYVIAATHGKRAVDNLAAFKPYIKEHEMDDEVTKFEESILFYADAYNIHGPGSRSNSFSNSPMDSPLRSPASSGFGTPDLTPASSAPSSRASSIISSQSRRPSFTSRLQNLLRMSAVPETHVYQPTFEDTVMEANHSDIVDEEALNKKTRRDELEAWQIEAASVDRSVRILPGVKRLMNSIPAGRYAVATSGAKTYAHGCMTRVGITPPPVTITADDKRLKAGKPAPDPFLLAAKCLGYDASKCVVFEDSPSGIRAGVSSGATVIAVCTSHERSKIENCGAHFLVENMNSVKCELEGDKLKFTITV